MILGGGGGGGGWDPQFGGRGGGSKGYLGAHDRHTHGTCNSIAIVDYHNRVGQGRDGGPNIRSQHLRHFLSENQYMAVSQGLSPNATVLSASRGRQWALGWLLVLLRLVSRVQHSLQKRRETRAREHECRSRFRLGC